jgi:hypothetical protein
MYKIISKQGLALNDVPNLDEALVFAKSLGVFVTIKGPEFEVCGVFGVDEVTDPNYNGWISRKHDI